MFRGGQRQGGYSSTRTFVRGVILLLLGALLSLTNTHTAHAVSSGCIAVRGGALNTGGIDVNFTGTFEAGETVVWTFTGGGGADEVTVTPPGGLLPVVGRVATFTFPATGSFLIAETGGQAVTATCNETTPEKQAAVKAAVKTLTEMQLIQSLAFQGQLLTELTGLFLSGAVPVMTLARLEQKLAGFEQQKTQNIAIERQRLAQQIATQRGFIKKFFQPVVDQYNRELARRKQAQDYLDSLRTDRDWREYLWAQSETKRLQLDVDEAFEAWNLAIGERTAAIVAKDEAARSTAEGKIYKKELAFYKAAARRDWPMDYVRKYHYRAFSIVLPKKFEADRTIAAANNQMAALQGKYDAAQRSIATKNAYIAGLQAQTSSRIAKLQSEASAITAEIRAQISALKTRVGQPAAPFAGANLQGALGLTSVQGPNPLRLKSSGAGNLSFFTDLNTLRRQAREEVKLQQAGGQGPQVLTETGSANILNPAYNIWAKGNFSEFESDQAGADREGQAYSFATGAYVAPNSRFMIGTMYRYRKSESESTAQSSDVETRGHGAGVYSTLVLTPKLSLSVQALYERSDNDIKRGVSAITPAATTGSFDADQYVASGSLQGTFQRGPFWLRPTAGVTYAYVDSDAFTDSAGTLIPGQTTEQVQLTFGPAIGFRVWRKGKRIKFIEPSFSATGVWTLKDEGDTTLASGTIIEQDDVAAQFTAGLSILLRNNTQISFNAGYSGLGDSKVESYSFGGQISIPFGGR